MTKAKCELFPADEMQEIRKQFLYVEQDCENNGRLFFDNAGGSLRLAAAEEAFRRADSIPDCSEHSNRVARLLEGLELQGRRDLMECVFGAKGGVLFPCDTASRINLEMCRVFAENGRGTNVVTTTLEHPSSYDGMKRFAGQSGREFRVAPVNRGTGGVDAEAVLSLVDRNTAVLSCMHASNISGYIYDVETIFRRARERNPDILILCDAVQHAPHAWLDPEGCGADAVVFAPYKFFGVRGFGAAWLSERAASLPHHRLLGKPEDEWGVGSPAPGHYASMSAVVDYVTGLGKKELPAETDRKTLYRRGMERIAAHERALLSVLLDGTEDTPGLRSILGARVQMDGAPLSRRDLIVSVEFDRIPCERAALEYEKRGIIAFERAASSLYSKRMVAAFGSSGVVRISPLHVHTAAEMEHFLRVTQEIALLPG